jgi:hypothetical protein
MERVATMVCGAPTTMCARLEAAAAATRIVRTDWNALMILAMRRMTRALTRLTTASAMMAFGATVRKHVMWSLVALMGRKLTAAGIT